MKGLFLAAILVAANAPAQPVTEPLGPSSRRTPLTISEILYQPADRVDERNLEFIELYNSNPWPEDISGWRLDGQVQFVFPAPAAIPAMGFVVVAAAPADVQAVYGLANVFGPYTDSLKSSGAVKLYDEQNALLLHVSYDRAQPWPMGADGTGHSIVLARPSYGEGDPKAWSRSEAAGGSPGAAETIWTNALRHVVLNEVLAHTDPPDVDSIELYNHSAVPVNLSGCTLSDDPLENKFVIRTNFSIPARGFVFFTEAQLGFGLDAAGETIYFKTPDGSRVLDALRFEAQENGVSYGRYPNGAADWRRLSAKSLGASNTVPLASPVGFNEIMYHPLSQEDDDQYLELFNRGTNAVDLRGWKIKDGISYTFPSNQVLAPNGYLVVARNASRLMVNYPQLNLTNTVGNFGGRLAGSGERLVLTKPDIIVGTNDASLLVTNHVDIVVDEVTYGTGGRWGRWSDGGGSSLELVDARADKRRAASWADSDETAKAPWTNLEIIGVVEGNGGSSMQLGLLDAGECLVDDVDVRSSATGANFVTNPDFEAGMTGLAFVGNHCRTSLETNSGYPASGTALHVRTADSIQAGPNGITLTLTNTLYNGQTATVRYKGRWLHGCPEPILRQPNTVVEVAGRLTVPANLGTPGLPNSRSTTNAGPAIFEVAHTPALPAANQAVVVAALISDPDGIAGVTLSYRFDPLTSTTNLTMNDSGTNGDLVAGDGIYSETLPGRILTNAIAFTIQAADTRGATNHFPELLPDHAPNRECVVFFGDPTPTNLFGAYHLWLTRTNVSRWMALPKMSNEDIDGTLVYHNRIIYNMGGRFSGSPFHQTSTGPAGYYACHYVWDMPKDDRLLGATSFNKIHWPGNDIQYDTINSISDDPTLQREQAAYLLLRGVGVPWMNRRYVVVYVNGVRRGKLMEDALRPTGGTVKEQYLPDDTGVQLFKLQRWYPNESTYPFYECQLLKYTNAAGAWKPERYRPNWALKDSPGSLSDFTNVYALVTAANAYTRSNYVELLENVVDMENWLRVAAANHAAGNWDSIGFNSGQNMDAWVSTQHRWTLFTIDFSISLNDDLSYPPAPNLFYAYDSAWTRIFNTPKFRRTYLRALQELVNGAMLADKFNPVLDAKYAAFAAAGLAASSPSSTKTWVANARSSIGAVVNSNNVAAFTISTNFITASSNTVTLTGVAPLHIVSLRVNGELFTPVWTSVTNWTLVLPAPAGTSTWSVEALDRNGNPASGARLVTVENPSVPESPVGNVVFNEIMFNAPRPDAEYVELFNRSTNTPFDLSGWIVNGLDYTFPPGSILRPRGHLLLAKSSVAFAGTYSALLPVFGTFNGGLQPDGETLSLLQPGAPPEPDLVVDRVRYEAVAPWPAAPALVPGTSLQLVDVAQDNSRVANWSAGQTPGTARTPGTNNSVRATLPEFPTLWLNEVQAVNLTGPADNFGERDPWIEILNTGTNTVSLDGLYLGTSYASPMQWAFPADASLAPGQFLVVWLDGQPAQTSGAFLHADFRLDAGGSSVALSRLLNSQPQIVDYLNFPALPANYSYGDLPDGQPFYRQNLFQATPGGANSDALPAVTVSINEWMAENNGYLFNPATGKYDDWFELHNPSALPANLAGYYLTDSLVDPFRYEIPAGFEVPAGGFLLVWADDQTPANTNGTDLHVPFKLSKSGEAIGLFAPGGAAVDAVVFGAQTENVSEGRYPDAAGLRLFMPGPSPRGPNLLPPASRPPVLSGIAMQADHSYVLTFETQPGHVYRVEFKTDLDEPDWHPLGTSQFATGATLSFSDSPSAPQRFYRVALVE